MNKRTAEMVGGGVIATVIGAIVGHGREQPSELQSVPLHVGLWRMVMIFKRRALSLTAGVAAIAVLMFAHLASQSRVSAGALPRDWVQQGETHRAPPPEFDRLVHHTMPRR